MSALVPECVQVNNDLDIPIIQGKEDCLYLYVYTTSGPLSQDETETKKLKPVMLWIHGGGYFAFVLCSKSELQ